MSHNKVGDQPASERREYYGKTRADADRSARFIHTHIETIVAIIDKHDAGILDDGLYICPCKFTGSETDWHTHIADLISNQIDQRTQVAEQVRRMAKRASACSQDGQADR